ncbi:hypothetical protein JXB41_06575 [Candidatus Woesearchaeota archaeon]|nr:hypothetical protein [Candidatus Woesearchaeota archaeon]
MKPNSKNFRIHIFLCLVIIGLIFIFLFNFTDLIHRNTQNISNFLFTGRLCEISKIGKLPKGESFYYDNKYIINCSKYPSGFALYFTKSIGFIIEIVCAIYLLKSLCSIMGGLWFLKLSLKLFNYELHNWTNPYHFGSELNYLNSPFIKISSLIFFILFIISLFIQYRKTQIINKLLKKYKVKTRLKRIFDFIKLEKIPISNSSVLGYFIVFIISLVIAWLPSKIYQEIYKQIFSTKFIPLYILIVGIFIFICFFLLINIIYYLEKKYNMKINKYIVLSTFLVCLLLIVGVNILQKVYPSDLPYISKSIDFRITYKCDNRYPYYYENFIEGLDYKCTFQWPEKFSQRINQTMSIIVYPSREKFNYYPLYYDEYENKFYFFIWNISKSVEKYRFEYLINLENYTSPNLVSPPIFLDRIDILTKGKVLTIEEYHKKEFDKLSRLVALFSISVFSVFAALKNIMSLFSSK